jgi:RNA recognition motif-containing protein
MCRAAQHRRYPLAFDVLIIDVAAAIVPLSECTPSAGPINEGAKRGKTMARLYIGNLPHSTTEHELQAFLEEQGFRVETVQVIRDLETGGSRGFGFVELPEVVKAREAVETLNGMRMEGQNLKVSEARPVNLNTEGRQIGANRSPKRKAS